MCVVHACMLVQVRSYTDDRAAASKILERLFCFFCIYMKEIQEIKPPLNIYLTCRQQSAVNKTKQAGIVKTAGGKKHLTSCNNAVYD